MTRRQPVSVGYGRGSHNHEKRLGSTNAVSKAEEFIRGGRPPRTVGQPTTDWSYTMPPKRAAFLMWGDDEECQGVRKFLEDAGVVLDIRDLSQRPFTVNEVEKLVGFVPLEYFLNSQSDAFRKHHLDRDELDRDATIALIASDPTLLRQPIIRTNRLCTVGCDRKKICNGSGSKNIYQQYILD